MKPIIFGTRGSALALAQTELIRAMLQKAHPALQTEVRIIKTSGDIFQTASLASSGGKGLFTKEIEDQMLQGAIDLAVHSLKDLPTILPDGLTIGAVPPREDARDVFISKRYTTLDSLPPGARVATSSVRRAAQLWAHRPDLQMEPIRGNLDTRLRKLDENPAFDATILAAAGLHRLGLMPQWPQFHFQVLDIDVMIPAVGQGAIAVEVREADLPTQELLSAVNDADVLACIEAERVFLRVLGGGCHVPFAAHATIHGDQMRMVAGKFSPDGKQAARTDLTGPKTDPHTLGERAAQAVGG